MPLDAVEVGALREPQWISSMAVKIFISYRRDDTSHVAARIYDGLSASFGLSNLFMDVDDTPPGIDFVSHIEGKLAECDILLALIGRQWLSAPARGRLPWRRGRRIDDPEDWVRIEIATALRRGLPVVPVLVDGTPMPDARSLPPELSALARRQAVSLRHEQFRADLQRLEAAIPAAIRAHAPAIAEAAPVQAWDQAGGRRWRGFATIGAVVVLGGLGVAAWQLRPAASPDASPESATQKASGPAPKTSAPDGGAPRKVAKAPAVDAPSTPPAKPPAASPPPTPPSEVDDVAASKRTRTDGLANLITEGIKETIGKALPDTAKYDRIAADLAAGRRVPEQTIADARDELGRLPEMHRGLPRPETAPILAGYGSRLTRRNAGLFKVAVVAMDGPCSEYALREDLGISVPGILRSKGYVVAARGERAALRVTVHCSHDDIPLPGHSFPSRRAKVAIAGVWGSTEAEYAGLRGSAEGYVHRAVAQLLTDEHNAKAIRSALTKLASDLPALAP